MFRLDFQNCKTILHDIPMTLKINQHYGNDGILYFKKHLWVFKTNNFGGKKFTKSCAYLI